MTKDEAQKM